MTPEEEKMERETYERLQHFLSAAIESGDQG